MPGSTRQSSVASATDGMTLTFGGSPTPERRLVSEIVECWIALLNLLAASVPTRDFIVSSTRERRGRQRLARAARRARGRADRSGSDRAAASRGPATPSARSFSHRIFFSATEMPNTSLPGANRVAAAEASLVEDVLGIDLGVVVLAHPRRAQRARRLLVRHRHQDDVARRAARSAASATMNAISCTTPSPFMSIVPRPQIFPSAISAPNGSCCQRGGIGRDDVHVVQQQQRLRRCRCP